MASPISSTARSTPSSARMRSPKVVARPRIRLSPRLSRIARASRSAVSLLLGIGAGPTPSLSTRRPQKGWSPPAGTTTVGLPARRPSAGGPPRLPYRLQHGHRSGPRVLACRAPEADEDGGFPRVEEACELLGGFLAARQEPVSGQVDVLAPFARFREYRGTYAVQRRRAALPDQGERVDGRGGQSEPFLAPVVYLASHERPGEALEGPVGEEVVPLADPSADRKGRQHHGGGTARGGPGKVPEGRGGGGGG